MTTPTSPVRFQWIKYKGQWTVARIERKDDDWTVHIPGETMCLGGARTEKIIGPAVADINPTNGVPIPFDPWTGEVMPPPVQRMDGDSDAPGAIDPLDEERGKVLRLLDILGEQNRIYHSTGVMPATIRVTPHEERDIDVILENEERNLRAFREGDVAVAEDDLKKAQEALAKARSARSRASR
jgi:hypothetical protein